MRGTRWSRLRVAGCGRSNGQGPFWGDLVGPNPTDRAKNGVKRSLLVEAGGGPLSVVVAGANVPDFKLLEQTLDTIVVDRGDLSSPTDRAPQNLCLDKGYDNRAAREIVERHGYTPHIRRIGEEKKDAGVSEDLPEDQLVLKTYSEHQGLLALLEDEGVVEHTGQSVPTGYELSPIVRLTRPIPDYL